jgi:hypothetical protein
VFNFLLGRYYWDILCCWERWNRGMYIDTNFLNLHSTYIVHIISLDTKTFSLPDPMHITYVDTIVINWYLLLWNRGRHGDHRMVVCNYLCSHHLVADKFLLNGKVISEKSLLKIFFTIGFCYRGHDEFPDAHTCKIYNLCKGPSNDPFIARCTR